MSGQDTHEPCWSPLRQGLGVSEGKHHRFARGQLRHVGPTNGGMTRPVSYFRPADMPLMVEPGAEARSAVPSRFILETTGRQNERGMGSLRHLSHDDLDASRFCTHGGRSGRHPFTTACRAGGAGRGGGHVARPLTCAHRFTCPSSQGPPRPASCKTPDPYKV
jgi:hypothetical protein